MYKSTKADGCIWQTFTAQFILMYFFTHIYIVQICYLLSTNVKAVKEYIQVPKYKLTFYVLIWNEHYA